MEKIDTVHYTPEKVYCNKCRYHDTSHKRFGNKVLDTVITDTPFERETIRYCCEYEKDNIHNHCPYYKKRWWW